MASFVNQAVPDAFEAKKEERYVRKQHTVEEIKTATDLALALGAVEAGARTGIKSATIHTWKTWYMEHNKKYFVPGPNPCSAMRSRKKREAASVARHAQIYRPITNWAKPLPKK